MYLAGSSVRRVEASLSVAPEQATVSDELRMQGARCPLITRLSVPCRAIPAIRPGRAVIEAAPVRRC